MPEIITRQLTLIESILWKPQNVSLVYKILRALYATIRDLGDGYLQMRAKSLVYTTLLSIVPMLAVSFSFLKAFGVHNQVKPFLLELLAPLGDKGNDITENIIQFIDNVNVGVLGAIGIVILLFTVVSVISTLEMTLNSIWHIEQSRKFTQRFVYYLSIIVLTPVLAFAGMAVSASLLNAEFLQSILSFEPFGSLYYLAVLLMPTVLLWLAFLFIYMYLPNTQVNFGSALIGALIAALLWRIAGQLFTNFVVQSANYDAIYSGFATLIIFLIWLYISWLIFLIGGKLAFYFQHANYMVKSDKSTAWVADNSLKLVLSVMLQIANRHKNDVPHYNMLELSEETKLIGTDLQYIMDLLISENILIMAGDKMDKIVLAKDLVNIDLYQLIKLSQKLPQMHSQVIQQYNDAIDTIVIELNDLIFEKYNQTSLDHLLAK